MSFNPKVIFHRADTGAAVSITINSTKLQQLQVDAALTLAFNYEEVDVDDQGQVVYVQSSTVRSELNSIIGTSSTFERPTIISPVGNGAMFTGTLRASTFTKKNNSNVTHRSTTWYASHSKNFDNSLGTNKTVTISSGDLTSNSQWTQSSLNNASTPYVYIKVKYTASDGTYSYSLPMQFTTRTVTRSIDSISAASARSIEATPLSLEEQMEALQSKVDTARSKRWAFSEETEVAEAYQYKLNMVIENNYLTNDGDLMVNDEETGLGFKITSVNSDSADLVMSKFSSVRLDIFNSEVPSGVSEDLFLNSPDYNYGFKFKAQDGSLVSTLILDKSSPNVILPELIKGIFLEDIVVVNSGSKKLSIRATISLEDEEDQVINITKKVYSNSNSINYMDGDIAFPENFGIDGFDNLARYEGDIPEKAVKANWSIRIVQDPYNSDVLNTTPVWETTITKDLRSIGVYSGEFIGKPSEFRNSKLHQELKENFPNFEIDYNGEDVDDYEIGLPLHSINVYKALRESNGYLTVVVCWKDNDDNILGYNNVFKEVKFSKYEGLDRNELFSNIIYKLPFLTTSVSKSNLYLGSRYYVEPITKSASILNPLGHSESTIAEYGEEENTNILESMLTSPYTVASSTSYEDFNYVVFNSVNHLADIIYSLSFYSALPNGDISIEDKYAEYSKNLMFRRPITITIGNPGYSFRTFSSFDLGREDIVNILKENNITPEYFINNPDAERRIHISVYSGINIPGYPVFMESLFVAFKDEINGIDYGPDGYLNVQKDIEKSSKMLDYDKDMCSTNYTNNEFSSNGSDSISNKSGFKSGNKQLAISYLPNALKLFKANFEYYGTIPFWLCTDRSILGHKGTFVPRLEGYKEGQEVVHPVTGDLYLCIKDRPGTIEKLTKDNLSSVKHTYGVDEASYSVLEDTEYFIKVATVDNSFKLEDTEYKKAYKSSLPTYLSLLSYLNLLVNSKEGLMFNPYNSDLVNLEADNDRVFSFKDDKEITIFKDGMDTSVNGSLFPYKYLEEYLDAMEKNKSKYEFTEDMKTPAAEMDAAKEDDKFGAWFKLKNINTHNYFYMSTRPVLWVKDRRTIARANMMHPRNTVIRVGLKFYYLRLVTDQFYPNDDCCMESNIISSIPNQTLDFTSFNDPSVINFKESIIGPTMRNILHMATGKTAVTDRDQLVDSKEIYKYSITKNNENTNFFSRRGTLLYSASPYKFYMGNKDRVLSCYQDDKILSVLTYNLHDSIPDIEFGSSESKLGENEIVFKEPVDISKFETLTASGKIISALEFQSDLNSSKTMTGIYQDEKYSSYNEGLDFVDYKNKGSKEKKFEDYYPVYFVLEEVKEKDLPIYNIKNSLSGFVNEKESKSIVKKLDDLSFKVDQDVSDVIKSSNDVNLFKTYTSKLLTPSYSSNNGRIVIPKITNGGYGMDRVKDINYTLTSDKAIDIINYKVIEGVTPDTMFNTSPEDMYNAQDRKTFGTINLDDVKEGNYSHYSVINSTTAERENKVFAYDRWTMSGYLGAIDINNSSTKNILFPQLEKILKHRLVNNDIVRRKEKELYPLIHVYYFNTKLLLVPSSTPFDLYEEDRYGFKFTQEMEHIEIGRTKPIDSLSKDVNRVKLGANVFDVIIPYINNDKNIRSNQELSRNIVVTESYKEIK